MRPKSKIYTPKQDDEHPHPFHMWSPPPWVLDPVVQKVDSTIRWINLYPVDSGFTNTYLLDSDLSSGERYSMFEQPRPGGNEFYLHKTYKTIVISMALLLAMF